MRKYWIVFLIVLAAGIVLTAVYSTQKQAPSDTPTRIATRDEIAPPGTVSNDIIRTNDESQIPTLMEPTPLIITSEQRILAIACEHGTDLCKLQANYDFVRTNYELQQGIQSNADYIRSPTEVLLFGQGSRLELSMLLASLDIAAGFHPQVLLGLQTAFVRVHTGNQTITMDPSCSGCSVMSANVQLNGDELVFS